LNNEELHNFTYPQILLGRSKSRRKKWAGHVARMGEERNVYRVLAGGTEGKRLLGRPRSRWEDEIRMDLMEIGWECRLRIGAGGGLM
jgi:hypothetical protein